MLGGRETTFTHPKGWMATQIPVFQTPLGCVVQPVPQGSAHFFQQTPGPGTNRGGGGVPVSGNRQVYNIPATETHITGSPGHRMPGYTGNPLYELS